MNPFSTVCLPALLVLPTGREEVGEGCRGGFLGVRTSSQWLPTPWSLQHQFWVWETSQIAQTSSTALLPSISPTLPSSSSVTPP